MTVTELIQRLSELPGDIEVVLMDNDGTNDSHSIGAVTLESAIYVAAGTCHGPWVVIE